MKHPPNTLSTAPWLIAKPTQTVLGTLNRRGYTARIVGGAVRNALLGIPVTDIDIATVATPDEVLAAAREEGLKTIATGLQHGTVTIVVDGHPFEVTTLRHDVETDGRHAVVAYTDDWVSDASRRDLTLNALYCDAGGTIFDPLGGMADLVARRVRFIGDAHQRIKEDYLRILRFFRFTAQYAEGAPDAQGMAAAIAERDGLHRLSAERVRAELVRLLAARRAVPVCRAMAEHGLLTAILPVAPRLAGLAKLAAIEEGVSLEPDQALRLAALTVAVHEDAARLAERLRLSRAERDVLELAAASTEISPAASVAAQRALLFKSGDVAFRRIVLLAWARSAAGDSNSEWRHMLELPMRWRVPSSPFSGRDLIARGIAPGVQLGSYLQELEAWWIGADFPDDPDLLRAAVDRTVSARRV